MDFVGAIKNGFRNYANAAGRATRSEFWYWTLFSFLVAAAGAVIDMAIFGVENENGLFGPLLSLALLIPDVAVSIWRLHDLDRKWAWLLINFTGIGAIVLLVWFCMKGTSGPNRFGPDPLARPDHIRSSRLALPLNIFALSSSHSGTFFIHSTPGGLTTNGQSTANRMRSTPISCTQHISAGLEKIAAGGDPEVVAEDIAEADRLLAPGR